LHEVSQGRVHCRVEIGIGAAQPSSDAFEELAATLRRRCQIEMLPGGAVDVL
jgi:hypothetical protein